MKKLLIVLAAIFGLLLVAAVAVPLFVDVDKYRPQILEAANKNLNGKLELGHLKLSLWGRVRVDIEGLKLTDARGTQVVAVHDAYFDIPFTSLLTGSPSLILNMNQPTLNVVKLKTGKMNLMTLAKGSGEPSAPSAGGAPSKAKEETKIPGIAARARLGAELRNAQVTYTDQVTGTTTTVKDLNMSLRDLSLSREMSIEISANLDTEAKSEKGKGGMILKGPAKLEAKAKPTITGGKFESVSLRGKIDLDGLDILVPGVFHKTKSHEAHVDMDLSASPKDGKIDRFDLKFFNADVHVKGTVTNLGEAAGSRVDLSVRSNTIDLKPWNELVPALKEYELGGTALINVAANGPSDKMHYDGEVKVDGLTAKAPNLKAQPRIDMLLKLATDNADFNATMKAPANDLRIAGKVASFSKPRANFQVTSSGMDLDQLIEFPKPSPAKGGGTTGGSATEAKKGAPKSDLDAALAPLRENKTIRETVANIGVDIPRIKAYGITFGDIRGKMTFKDLVASIDSFTMKLFGGAIGANASTDLKPKAPTYRFSAKVTGLDLRQAVDSQLHLFRNTVLGKAAFDMQGSGASFNADPAIENLKAKGKLRVDGAEFTSIDVGKMVGGALNSALAKVGDRVPGLKGKTVNLPQGGSKYDSISSDFSIAGGKFNAPNFMTKAVPGKGIDLKGSTVVGLKDYSLDAHWEVIDTYNMTHAKDISNGLLAERGQPVRFPVSVGCTVSAPCYSYTQVPEYLAKVALKNATGQVQSQVQKKAGDLLKDKLKGFGGGFLGH